MKTKITITVDADILENFDKLSGSKLIPRSTYVNELMKNEYNNWSRG
ncbi:hypothetical protein RSJ42_05880 [Methanosarcina hadiensis]